MLFYLFYKSTNSVLINFYIDKNFERKKFDFLIFFIYRKNGTNKISETL